jgi:hypothetical protein
MRPFLRTLFAAFTAALLIWGAAGLAEAGNIRLNSICRTAVTAEGLSVNVRTTNIGDETAHDLRIIVRMDDQTKASPNRPELPPGGLIEETLLLPEVPEAPGTYGVPVRMEFQDVNGKRLSALVHASFTRFEPAMARLNVRPEEVTLDADGNFTLEMVNPETHPLKARVRVFAPSEFQPPWTEKWIELSAQGRGRLEFTLASDTALAGDRHALPVFVEYDADGKHFFMAHTVYATVGRPGEFFVRFRWPILGLAAAMMLTALAIEAGRIRRRRG